MEDSAFGDGSLAYAAGMFKFTEDEVEAAFAAGEIRKKKRAHHRRREKRRTEAIQRQKKEDHVRGLESDWDSRIDHLGCFSPVEAKSTMNAKKMRKMRKKREQQFSSLYGKDLTKSSKASKSVPRPNVRQRKRVTETPLKYYSADPRVTYDRVSGSTDPSVEGTLHIEALKAVVLRESLIKRLRELLRARDDRMNAPHRQVFDIINQCRKTAIDAVRAILTWRSCFVDPREFVWHGEGEKPVNYLLRMSSSLDFLDKCENMKQLGVSARRNPLLLRDGESNAELDALSESGICDVVSALNKEEGDRGVLSASEVWCSWCGMLPRELKGGGKTLAACGKCRTRFCKRCVEVNFPSKRFEAIKFQKTWCCFDCEEKKKERKAEAKRRGELARQKAREERERLQEWKEQRDEFRRKAQGEKKKEKKKKAAARKKRRKMLAKKKKMEQTQAKRKDALQFLRQLAEKSKAHEERQQRERLWLAKLARKQMAAEHHEKMKREAETSLLNLGKSALQRCNLMSRMEAEEGPSSSLDLVELATLDEKVKMPARIDLATQDEDAKIPARLSLNVRKPVQQECATIRRAARVFSDDGQSKLMFVRFQRFRISASLPRDCSRAIPYDASQKEFSTAEEFLKAVARKEVLLMQNKLIFCPPTPMKMGLRKNGRGLLLAVTPSATNKARVSAYDTYTSSNLAQNIVETAAHTKAAYVEAVEEGIDAFEESDSPTFGVTVAKEQGTSVMTISIH